MERSIPPVEQSGQGMFGLEQAWGAVIAYLQYATLEIVDDLSEHERQGMRQDFWPNHVKIMERIGPEMTRQVFLLAEQKQHEALGTGETQHKERLMHKIGSFIHSVTNGMKTIRFN